MRNEINYILLNVRFQNSIGLVIAYAYGADIGSDYNTIIANFYFKQNLPNWKRVRQKPSVPSLNEPNKQENMRNTLQNICLGNNLSSENEPEEFGGQNQYKRGHGKHFYISK